MSEVNGLKDRVVIVTGGGRGVGREYCLALGAAGAKVVVNDLGVGLDGRGADPTVAEQVAEEVRALGGEAFASAHDVSDTVQASNLLAAAIGTFGDVHAVINNAGVVRDAMFVNTGPEDWDESIRGCLRSHYALSHAAARYWREQHKAGRRLNPRIVNTTSGAGLFGSVGQSNYSAAKAAIAALTIVQATELQRYGVLANAVAPVARTRLTENLFKEMMATEDSGFDSMHPGNIAPITLWLCSAENTEVTGRVFEAEGSTLTICMNWHRGPAISGDGRFTIGSAGATAIELNQSAPDLVPVYA